MVIVIVIVISNRRIWVVGLWMSSARNLTGGPQRESQRTGRVAGRHKGRPSSATHRFKSHRSNMVSADDNRLLVLTSEFLPPEICEING